MDDSKLRAAYGMHQSGNLAEACRLYLEVLQSQPRNFTALYLLGFLHLQNGQHEEGERWIASALEINPNSLDALFNHGEALQRLGRHDEAIAAYDRVLARNPSVTPAWASRGRSLLALRRNDEALASLDHAVADSSATAEAWNNRARVLLNLNRVEEALASYDHALALQPLAALYSNRGNALSMLGRFEEAAQSFEKALELDPAIPYARGSRVFCNLRQCDWSGLQQERQNISRDLAAGLSVIQPGELIAVSAFEEDQLRGARLWVSHEVPVLAAPLCPAEPYGHDRIRLAYVTADFRAHAILQLMTGVFEQHDRNRFETIALSLGRDDGSPLRKRAATAFDRFIEVPGDSDIEIARLLRKLEVDIAVDLMGFTEGCRPAIFAMRPAPLQVNYLGFPGTMGADYIDYIIADRTVIPREQQSYYTENVVYLPDSFQANDLERPLAERVFTRSELELPDKGFVFCSFNNHFKIAPEMFDVWVRLLKEVDGSVLWLLQNTDAGARNLRLQAEARGVSGERLIFAPRMAIDDHVARHRAADLFLDTLPCNSGTTASDALWAGLPVLTCLGTTFAGRVAASLLHAAGLHELVTNSLEEYETKALQITRDREMLTRLRSKLLAKREANPLFDTRRFTRHLEAAFTTMWERHERGQAPAPFAVEPLPALERLA